MNANDQIICSVCFDDINPHKNQCITECGHQFCFQCIITIISGNSTNYNLCPICRTQMFYKPDYNDPYDSNTNTQYENTVAAYNPAQPDIRLAPISQVVRRLEDEGFDMGDLLSMYIRRYERNGKYSARYVNESFQLFVDIIHDIDTQITLVDVDNEALELDIMAEEDKRSILAESKYNYDREFERIFELIETSLMLYEDITPFNISNADFHGIKNN